jgi:hypothetical protein
VSTKDPHVLGPGLAPTPFTAAEIRDGCRPGRTITTHVEGGGGTSVRTTTYLSADAEGGEFESRVLGPDGAVDETEVGRATWAELQAHAAFPADRTTIEEQGIELATGPADCLLYTVSDGDVVRRFWFDTARPGMPVRVEIQEGGAVTSVRTVVADERLDG